MEYLILGVVLLLVAVFVTVFVIVDKVVEPFENEHNFQLLTEEGLLADENGYPRHLGYSADLDHYFAPSGA